jgi:hypothetical protein
MALVTFIVVGALASQARAGVFAFDFGGAGVSGSVELTYVPDPNTGVLGNSPNTVDPVGAYIITGMTGTFSDLNIGIVDAAITGVVPRNPVDPEPTNHLAPASFGFYLVADGVPSPHGPVRGLTYDDLFYPGGSPQTATDYPVAGGFLDIYGVVFTVTGGDAVDFWSGGDAGTGAVYGAAVTDGTQLLDYVGSGVLVPEPGSVWLLGMGLLGALAWRRRSLVASAAG